MNDSTPENIPETPVESQPAPAPQFDARRRLRELLSTPERDRTDEQWDEIIELEIQLAPGNRVSGNEQPGSANQGRSGHRDAALPLERSLFLALFDDANQREGVVAFLEKRAPCWHYDKPSGESHD